MAVGRILRPHGVEGHLLLEAAPDLGGVLEPGLGVLMGADLEPAVVRSVKPHGPYFRLLLEGCSDRDQAEHWRDASLSLRVDQLAPLAPGTYYRWQLVGMRVVSDEDESLGFLAEILSTGANDVYRVLPDEGGELLLPAIDSVVLNVDLAAGVMRVHLLPGLREAQ